MVNGLIPDPFFRDNELKVQWVEREDRKPRLVTSGIWRPVSLEAWDRARIDEVMIPQEFKSKEEVILRVKLSVIFDNFFDMIPGKKYEVEFLSLEKISVDNFRRALKIITLKDTY